MGTVIIIYPLSILDVLEAMTYLLRWCIIPIIKHGDVPELFCLIPRGYGNFHGEHGWFCRKFPMGFHPFFPGHHYKIRLASVFLCRGWEGAKEPQKLGGQGATIRVSNNMIAMIAHIISEHLWLMTHLPINNPPFFVSPLKNRWFCQHKKRKVHGRSPPSRGCRRKAPSTEVVVGPQPGGGLPNRLLAGVVGMMEALTHRNTLW